MFEKLDQRDVTAGILATAVVLGLLSPGLTRLAAPLALPALFFVVVFALVPFAKQPRSDVVSIRLPVLRMLAWQQILLPAIVIAVCIVGKLPDYCIVVAVVAASSGSLFASPALAEMLALDRRRALQGMVLSTLLTPATMYMFLNLFRDAAVHVSFASYLQRIVIFLVVPFVIFALYRALVGRMSSEVVGRIDQTARYGTLAALAIFCVGIMCPLAQKFRIEPGAVMVALLCATLLFATMFVVTAVVFYRFGHVEAMTAGLLSGFRNVGLGYALVGDSLGQEFAVFVGASMLPMFITPFLLRIYLSRQRTQSSVPA